MKKENIDFQNMAFRDIVAVFEPKPFPLDFCNWGEVYNGTTLAHIS